MRKLLFAIIILVAGGSVAYGFTMERIWVAYGDTAERRFGRMASGVGDINDDGYGDFVICRRYANPLLFYGGNPPDTVADLEFSVYGYGVKGGFDLNGDGNPDFVLASYYDTVPSGSLYVYFGGQLFSSEPHLRLASSLCGGPYGGACDLMPYNLDISGDINGDGYNDIVVYSGEEESGHTAVLVFLGGQTIATEPDYVIENTAEILSVGDFNGIVTTM